MLLRNEMQHGIGLGMGNLEDNIVDFEIHIEIVTTFLVARAAQSFMVCSTEIVKLLAWTQEATESSKRLLGGALDRRVRP